MDQQPEELRRERAWRLPFYAAMGLGVPMGAAAWLTEPPVSLWLDVGALLLGLLALLAVFLG